jgi:hypothetical protein
MAGKGRKFGLMFRQPRLGLLLFVRLAGVIRVRGWLKQFEHLAIADPKDIGLTTLANSLLGLKAEPFTVDKDVHHLPPHAGLVDDG